MTGVNTPDCTVCGRPDDNLSSLGRCWTCIKASSAAWEAKIAASRDLSQETLPCDGHADQPRYLRELDARRATAVPRSSVALRSTPVGRFRGLLRTVNEAPEGSRNATLHWAACRVGEMVASGELPDASSAADALAQVAAGTGLDPREIRGTIRSGFASSGVHL